MRVHWTSKSYVSITTKNISKMYWVCIWNIIKCAALPLLLVQKSCHPFQWNWLILEMKELNVIHLTQEKVGFNYQFLTLRRLGVRLNNLYSFFKIVFLDRRRTSNFVTFNIVKTYIFMGDLLKFINLFKDINVVSYSLSYF